MKFNKIIILLSTYNGSKYIKEQLTSLLSQSYKNIEIIVRDDGSSDDTLEILKSYDITLLETKKNLGAKGSFAELLNYAIPNRDSDYFMFCDQDDIWKEDKIEKTLNKMKDVEEEFGNIPILIHTDLEVVDEELNTINNSFMKYQNINQSKDKFHNLLMQNVITGCTMMINRKLAEKSLSIPNGAIMHDWWIGLVASKFGKIGYIDEATIKYRQHGKNTVGAKGFGLKYILDKLGSKITINSNISQVKAFLDKYKNMLDSKTIQLLEDFISIEQESWLKKRMILFRHNLFKQGFIRNLGLLIKL